MRLLIFVLFFLLVAIGALLSRPLYRNYIEQDLYQRSARVLEDVGKDEVEVRFNHLFGSAEGNVSSKMEKRLIARNIDEGVWGAYIDGTGIVEGVRESASVVAEFGAGSEVLTLTGKVSDDTTRASIAEAVASVPGVSEVVNQIEVSPNVVEPNWNLSIGAYLSRFISTPGTRKLSLNNKGLTLEGTVDTDSIRSALGTAGEKIVAPNLISNLLQTKSLLPALFSATREGAQVVLKGRLPSVELRDALLSEVRSTNPGKEILDQTTVMQGLLQPWWGGSSQTLVPQFFREAIGNSAIAYGPNSLLLRGEVPDQSSATILSGAAHNEKPIDFSLQTVLTVAPGSDSAVSGYTGSDQQFTLYGAVKDSATGGLFADAVSRSDSSLEIKNELETRSNAKNPGWNNPDAFVSALIKNAESESFELTAKRLVMRGIVPSEEIKTDLGSQAQTVIGPNGKVLNLLTVASAPEPVRRITRGFRNTLIYFDTASSEIKETEESKVEIIATLITNYEDNSKLIVGGYADRRGDTEYNRQLSLERANAVRNRLVELGIPNERMTVEHFGEDVSPNELWRARRVELSLSLPGEE